MGEGIERTSIKGNVRQVAGRLESFYLSLFACTQALLVFMLFSEHALHWFVLPVLLCGILIGIDAVDWLRGRLDIFDPVGIIGLLGVHFFFVAPLLHVYWDYWTTPGQLAPVDWRDWLGLMATINFVGLTAYWFSRRAGWQRVKNRQPKAVWRLERGRVPLVLGVALVVSLALQVWVYARFGGIMGYIMTYALREGPAFRGLGWVFMLSESFPILAMIGWAVYSKKCAWARNWIVLGLVVAIFFVLRVFFGGLRGSRGNTVWAIFWAVGIIHFWIRPVPRKFVYAGAAILLVFMSLYALYKSAGPLAVHALESAEIRATLEEQTGRTRKSLFLLDLSRSDMQAFLLYQTTANRREYNYAWGRTYLGAAALLIPRSLWPGRPPTKAKEGTEAQHGLGTYDPGGFRSTRVYGLAGETMLNFGPLAVPFAFIFLGLVVGVVKGWLLVWDSWDTRLLLLPILVSLCIVLLVGDSDNVLFSLIKNAALPFAVIAICSHRHTVSIHQPKTSAR